MANCGQEQDSTSYVILVSAVLSYWYVGFLHAECWTLYEDLKTV